MPIAFRPIPALAGQHVSLPLGLTGVGWPAVTAFLAGSLAIAVGFAASADYARKETATGYVAPAAGTVRVVPPRPGTLAALAVGPGDAVAAGDILFTLDTRQSLEGGGTLDAILRDGLLRQRDLVREQIAAEESRAAAELDRLRSRLQGLAAELDSLSAQRGLQAERAAVAGERLKALTDLRAKGFVSEAEYKAREEAWLGQRQSLAALDQRIAALAQERRQTEIQLAQAPAESADRLARLRATEAELAQRKVEVAAQGALTVRAPAPGRVTGIQAQPGQRIDPTKPVLSIVPEDGALRAELFVPSRAIGFVEPGQRVRLMYDAFPFQRFGTHGGTVETVSETMLSPEEALGPVRLPEPAYRVTVALDRPTVNAFGRDVALQPDMTLRADIVLEERTLLEWLLEPLLSARGRM